MATHRSMVARFDAKLRPLMATEAVAPNSWRATRAVIPISWLAILAAPVLALVTSGTTRLLALAVWGLALVLFTASTTYLWLVVQADTEAEEREVQSYS